MGLVRADARAQFMRPHSIREPQHVRNPCSLRKFVTLGALVPNMFRQPTVKQRELWRMLHVVVHGLWSHTLVAHDPRRCCPAWRRACLWRDHDAPPAAEPSSPACDRSRNSRRRSKRGRTTRASGGRTRRVGGSPVRHQGGHRDRKVPAAIVLLSYWRFRCSLPFSPASAFTAIFGCRRPPPVASPRPRAPHRAACGVSAVRLRSHGASSTTCRQAFDAVKISE